MSLIKRPRTLKMAPPGFHVVKRHANQKMELNILLRLI